MISKNLTVKKNATAPSKFPGKDFNMVKILSAPFKQSLPESCHFLVPAPLLKLNPRRKDLCHILNNY